MVRVKQVEIDFRKDTAANSCPCHNQIEFRRRPEAAGKNQLGHVVTFSGGSIGVTDIKSLQKQQWITEVASDKLLYAKSVVTEGKVDDNAEFGIDGNAERSENREKRRILEFKRQRRHVIGYQNCRCTHQQAKDLRGIFNNREGKAAHLSSSHLGHG